MMKGDTKQKQEKYMHVCFVLKINNLQHTDCDNKSIMLNSTSPTCEGSFDTDNLDCWLQEQAECIQNSVNRPLCSYMDYFCIDFNTTVNPYSAQGKLYSYTLHCSDFWESRLRCFIWSWIEFYHLVWTIIAIYGELVIVRCLAGSFKNWFAPIKLIRPQWDDVYTEVYHRPDRKGLELHIGSFPCCT